MASVALAAVLVWRRPTRVVAGVVIVASVGAGVLDLIELGRHLEADRTGLAILAALLALLRAATVTGAVMVWRATHPPPARYRPRP